MKKWVLVIAILAVLALAVGLLLPGQKPPSPSAWLVLPDGSSNRIVAATYGTNHIIGSPFGRLLTHLPAAVQDKLPVLVHQTATAQPSLVLWLEHRAGAGAPTPGPGAPTYELLSDASGFISGPENFMVGGFGTVDIGPVAFETFPRRDPAIALNFFYRSPSGQATNWGRLQFPNPLHQTYPEWQPESLPATNRAGDVEVTLLSVQTGHDNNSRMRVRKGGGTEIIRGTNRLGGENVTAVDARFRNLAHLNQTWRAVSVQVSDASGNSLRSSGMGWGGNDGDNFTFQPALWPSEKAWKLNVEIKQIGGFTPEQLFTFKNVPLGALDTTSHLGWVTNFGGVTVTLNTFLRQSPLTNNSSWSSSQLSAVDLSSSPLTNSLQLDLVNVVFDTGVTNTGDGGWSATGNSRTYFFTEIPSKATNADFTFAVHHSRFVEFTVHPELPLPPANN